MNYLFVIVVNLYHKLVRCYGKLSLSATYDWTQVKTFEFFGFTNPKDNIAAKFIIADNDTIKKLFNNLKRSNSFFPKGDSQFAKITFNNNDVTTIQIAQSRNSPIRVVKKDLISDQWFNFDDIAATEWIDYIHFLSKKLNNFKSDLQ